MKFVFKRRLFLSKLFLFIIKHFVFYLWPFDFNLFSLNDQPCLIIWRSVSGNFSYVDLKIQCGQIAGQA